MSEAIEAAFRELRWKLAMLAIESGHRIHSHEMVSRGFRNAFAVLVEETNLRHGLSAKGGS